MPLVISVEDASGVGGGLGVVVVTTGVPVKEAKILNKDVAPCCVAS